MADDELQTQPNEQPETPEEPKEEPQELEPEEQSLANPEEPEAEAPEQPTEQEPEEEPQMSRRKAKRLEKLEGLVQRLKQPNQQTPPQSPQGIDYRKMIDADDPRLYDQLDKASQEYGQTQFQAGLEQANTVRFHTRLEIDAPRVEGKYPQFDQSSQEFNPGATAAINEWYLETVGYDSQTDTVRNPNLRYSDFVEGIMELADAMAGVRTTQSTQNIAKQAANAGLRPDGSSAKPLNWQGKRPEDMTDDELKAAVAATLPTRDARGRFISSN